MRKKLLSLTILLLFAVSAFNVNIIGVSAATDASIYIEPSSIENLALTPGENITVSIKTDYTGNDIWSYQFSLFYNPAVLEGVQAELANGDIITPAVSPTAIFAPGEFNNNTGELSLTYAYFFYQRDIFPFWPAAVASGPGTLANVTFTVVDYGASNILLGPDTQLLRFTEGGYGEVETIIDAEYHPDQIQHGYFQNTATVTHDIAVTSVTPSPTSVILGGLVDITVDVENQGNVNEMFSVTAYYDTNAIETKTVTNLGTYATTSLTFAWDTTGVALGTYTINATASTVPGETNTLDNTLVSPQTVTVTEPQPPVAVITAEETSAYVNEAIAFDGGESYDPDGGTIIVYYWDFGDGTNATGQLGVHVYTTIGFYTLTLVVTDSHNLVSEPATLAIKIEEPRPIPPEYSATLVKWKAKPEAHNWDYSNDLATDDGFLTLTALTRNLGTNAVNVTITFQIIDVITKMPIGPLIVKDVTLDVTGLDEPVDVLLDPLDYGYDGDKMRLQAQVTLEYDSDGDGTPDTDATQKTIRFAILP